MAIHSYGNKCRVVPFFLSTNMNNILPRGQLVTTKTFKFAFCAVVLIPLIWGGMWAGLVVKETRDLINPGQNLDREAGVCTSNDMGHSYIYHGWFKATLDSKTHPA